MKFYCSSVDFLVETWMNEIKPVVIEKNNYKYRDTSILKALFGTFET